MMPETLHRNAAFHDPTHDQGQAPCPECVATAATYPPAPPVKTEWHDGLEFEVPTWDPAATPWNGAGSWARDPDLTARLRAAILAAVPDFEQQVRDAIDTAVPVPVEEWCGTFWGSHGCSRASDHAGLCVCEPGLDNEGVCSVGMKWGDGDTLILAWNGETTPSTHHWTWFR